MNLSDSLSTSPWALVTAGNLNATVLRLKPNINRIALQDPALDDDVPVTLISEHTQKLITSARA